MRLRFAAAERDTEDLGWVRLCRRCNEEWPIDEEFWYFQNKRGRRVVMGHCRACWSERDRSRWFRKGAA